MKAISVRAPWWWFILHAGKDIENRDWPTKFRGTVYLHSSKWYAHGHVVEDIWATRKTIPGVLEKTASLGHPYNWLKPYGGCIVGKVDIVDCVSQSGSPWFFGKFGFVLANPVALSQPIPCKGSLGFFTVPEYLQEKLAAGVWQ